MESTWDSWLFLLGEWIGEGSGEPGRGEGGTHFAFDLDQKVLVRKNYASYPATGDRPPVSHSDLMIIYPEETGTFQAISFDNEGHVIYYTAAFSDDRETLTFVSAPDPSDPRFRLSYVKGKDRALTVRFEIAPPGRPEEFSVYTEGIIFPKRA